MPMRVIGMIGVMPPTSATTLHVIEGGLSPNYVAEAARAHEASGFDLVLVGYSSSSAEGFLVALHAAARAERLGYLIAHRPGFVAPTLMKSRTGLGRSRDGLDLASRGYSKHRLPACATADCLFKLLYLLVGGVDASSSGEVGALRSP